jgi:hypothetical protein
MYTAGHLQRAAVAVVLDAIYEEDVLGFSQGNRSGNIVLHDIARVLQRDDCSLAPLLLECF